METTNLSAEMADAAAETARVVQNIPKTKSLDDSTQCGDWDLRTLHGWDVAKATGQEYHATAALAEAVHDTVTKQAELFRKYDGFADAIQVGDDKTTFAKALALSGRDPG
jgi:hypothetical protein